MKKRSLFPILLIGFTLGLTSCNEDSKKEDITTNPFANLPADSGQKPTTEQMDAAIANFTKENSCSSEHSKLCFEAPEMFSGTQNKLATRLRLGEGFTPKS